MTGFKPRSSGTRSNRSTNCATTTAQKSEMLAAKDTSFENMQETLTRYKNSDKMASWFKVQAF